MKDNIIVGDAISHYKKLSAGKKAVAYCCGIELSKKTARLFCEAGIAAEHIDGETPDLERKAITNRFATGITKVLCNVDLITTGYDLASQSGLDVTIETIILLRPTKSLSLYLQMVGRGLRPKPEPAIILDHANCAKQHNLPADSRDWSLRGREKDGISGERAISVRQCPAPCFFSHSPAPKCPQCGYIYPIQSREVEHIDGELIEIKSGEQMVQIPKSRVKQLNYLMGLAKKKGIPNPIAFATKIINTQTKGK